MTNQYVGGWIPDKNGFIEGYGVTAHSQLTSDTGMSFRIYRNGVATTTTFTVTSGDNDSYGAVRARNFNTNPGSGDPSEGKDVCYFKAQERISLRAEAPAQEQYTESADITKINIFLYYVYDVIENETLLAQSLGSGIPGGSGTGISGGSGDDGDDGGGGTPPIVV